MLIDSVNNVCFTSSSWTVRQTWRRLRRRYLGFFRVDIYFHRNNSRMKQWNQFSSVLLYFLNNCYLCCEGRITSSLQWWRSKHWLKWSFLVCLISYNSGLNSHCVGSTTRSRPQRRHWLQAFHSHAWIEVHKYKSITVIWFKKHTSHVIITIFVNV